MQDFYDIEKIGAGAYWDLYRGVQKKSDTHHILQVLHESAAKDARLVALFKNLRDVRDVLHHDHILTPLAFESTDDYTFLMYEDFAAPSLLTSAEARSPLNEQQAGNVIYQVAEALQFAQIRGVRHGWVSPEMILHSPTNGMTKLIGFDSEKILTYLYENWPHLADQINGYIPPEHLQASISPAPEDCYALGVTFYQLVTGEMPFHGDSVAALKQNKLTPPTPPIELNPRVSLPVSELIQSLLDPEPYRRATYSSLLNELNPQNEQDVPRAGSLPGKESGLTKVRDLVSEFNPLNKNSIGSTKRIAYTVVVSVIALVILLGIVVVSRLSSNEEKRLQHIYDEYLAEQEYEEMNETSTYTWDSPHLSARENEQQTKKIERIVEQENTVENPSEMAASNVQPVEARLFLSVSAESKNVTAEVFVDGQRRGYSDTNGSCLIDDLLVNKTYRIRVVRDGYQQWERTVNIKDGENTLTVNLKPEVAELPSFSFAAVDFADQIKINDESVARNLPCTIKTAPGKMSVTYIDSKADFSWRTTLELTENQGPIFISADQVGQGDIVVVLNDPIEYGYAFVTIDNESEAHTTPFRAALNTGWHRVQVFRDNYTISPADTLVFIRPGVKLNLRCSVL